jgi:hypothetical protein
MELSRDRTEVRVFVDGKMQASSGEQDLRGGLL